MRLRLKLTQVTPEVRQEGFPVPEASLIISSLSGRAPTFRNTDREFSLGFLYRKPLKPIVSALGDVEPNASAYSSVFGGERGQMSK